MPTKIKNPASADATHILSKMTMTFLPMPSHGSNNNGRSLLRLPSGCRHKAPKFWVMKEAPVAGLLWLTCSPQGFIDRPLSGDNWSLHRQGFSGFCLGRVKLHKPFEAGWIGRLQHL